MPHFTLLFIIGMFMAYLCHVPYHWWIELVVVLLAVSIMSRNAKVKTLFLYASVLCCGAFALSSKLERMNDEVGERCDRLTITSSPRLSPSGKVYFMDAETRKGTLLQLSVLRDSTDASFPVPAVGDVLSVDGRVQSVEQSQWNLFHGYGGRLFLRAREWMKCEGIAHRLSLRESFEKQRRSLLANFLRQEIGEEEYAVLSAITLGDKTFISRELKDAYSKTGASHVLALSGMHLAVIFCILTYLLLRLFLLFDILLYNYVVRQKVSTFTNCLLDIRPEPYVYSNISTVLCCVFIWMYVLLVGAMPSVVRAASMLTIYSLLRLFSRQGRGLNILCITAFVMLLVNPLSLFDVGFQMSFLAVLGITLFYSKISKLYTIDFHEKGIRRLFKWLWNGMSLAFSAQLFVLPLIAFYFERIAVCSIFLSPVISLMAVIIVSGSMLFLFVNILAHYFLIPSIVLSYSATALSFLVSCQNVLLQRLSTLPFSYIDGIRISLPQLVLVYIILVSIILIAKKVIRPKPYNLLTS